MVCGTWYFYGRQCTHLGLSVECIPGWDRYGSGVLQHSLARSTGIRTLLQNVALSVSNEDLEAIKV
jgi:hypothetical protein